jgi:hypothetical protein
MGTRGTFGSASFNSRKGRHMIGGAIELSSQTDLEDFTPGGGATTNKFWAERQNTSSSGDSERGVLGLEATRSEIRKTVSVVITDQHAEDLGVGKGASIRRFEHT